MVLDFHFLCKDCSFGFERAHRMKEKQGGELKDRVEGGAQCAPLCFPIMFTWRRESGEACV